MLVTGRLLAAIAGRLVLAALAVAGLAAAVGSLSSGDGGVALPALTRAVGLDDLRDEAGAWLTRVESRAGGTAATARVAGAGLLALGLWLALAVLLPSRARAVRVPGERDGEVAVRRRPLARALRALAEQPRAVRGARVRVRPRRGGRAGGRVALRLDRAQTVEPDAVLAAASGAVGPLAERLGLRTRARTRVPRRGGRVA